MCACACDSYSFEFLGKETPFLIHTIIHQLFPSPLTLTFGFDIFKSKKYILNIILYYTIHCIFRNPSLVSLSLESFLCCSSSELQRKLDKYKESNHLKGDVYGVRIASPNRRMWKIPLLSPIAETHQERERERSKKREDELVRDELKFNHRYVYISLFHN